MQIKHKSKIIFLSFLITILDNNFAIINSIRQMMSVKNECEEIQVSIIATTLNNNNDDNAKVNGNDTIEIEEQISQALGMAHLNLEV